MVGHTKRVLSVSYKPTRPFRIFTSSEDMRTCFYEGPPFKLHHSDSAHSNFVNCIRFSPDGNRAVSVGSDKKIQAYDGKTGAPTADVANAHAGGIYSIAFSPDSAYFITASADKTVKLWNAETLALEQTFNISADPTLGDAQVAVLWTKAAMLSVSLNGNINILSRDHPDGVERVIQAHQASITAMAIDPTTQVLYSGSHEGVVCARALAGTSDAMRLKGQDKNQMSGAAHAGKVAGMAVVNGGLVSVGWDDKLRFATVSEGAGAYHTAVDVNGQPCSLATHASTDLYAVVTTAEVALYRGTDKTAAISVGQLGFQPTCAALRGEEELAVGGSDFKPHIYALQGGNFTPVKTIDTRSAVSALAYHPSGETLAIGDEGRQVELYTRAAAAGR
jgi:WD40 repeat protein